MCPLCFTLAAVRFDLRIGRIPNVLVMSGILTGLLTAAAFSLHTGNGHILLGSILGFLMPLILPGILFFFRMLGAGDIKLLCMIGSFLQAKAMPYILFYSFCYAAVFAAVRMIRSGIFLSRFQYFFEYVTKLCTTGRWYPYRKPSDDGASVICLSVPIFLGLTTYIMTGCI